MRRDQEDTDMQYIMIIAEDETASLRPGQPGFDEMMADYGAFTEMVLKLGVMKSGSQLGPVATATTVRIRDGETITTDGPFAETKEQFAGFYILDCKDLDQALELAARIPGAKHGSIEVRPLV